MKPPFRIAVYDKHLTRRGWIGDPISVHFTPVHNGQGQVQLTVASDHPRVPDLMTPGARLVVTYAGTETISGPVRGLSGEGPERAGQITVTVQDDIRLLWRVLGWAAPTRAVTAQGDDGAYWRATGAAETVLKAAVRVNAVDRLALPVRLAPDLGRGAVIPGGVSLRFHPLADRVLTQVEQAGLGVSVVQDGPAQQGTGVVLDVYQPKIYPRALTEAGGTLVDWKWNQDPPEATRVVAGGAGEGTARAFITATDTGRETEWGDVIEVFRDARDAETAATLAARAQETLTEGAPTSGLALTLAETGTFRYGGPHGVRVGDTVTIRLANGVELTDVLRQATITWDQDGLAVVPSVGDRTDDPSAQLAKAIGRLAGTVRELARR
ncbi:hypothetical protein CRM73_00110 [Kocuria sp. CCUG 69068]|uniref:siphovirus ReqiPepy6 Gp37-like family protein n=1 Tax=Kocuria sp. CCUG 69068 TaxID=2043138 RepID=UPI001E39114F|nr:hypothetical protein [Kocuria sp. CCUG 69068]